MLRGDDTDALASIKGLISDLGLEGEAVDFGQVEVFHLGELCDWL